MGEIKRVFVNGTFDIIHMGHLALLKYARSLGSVLLVAIDSDDRVKKLKGDTRPINNQDERATMIMELKPVNMVTIFNTDEQLSNIVKYYEPDIMVVGSDWKGKTVIGSEYAKEVIYFDRIQEYSTTKKIQDISSR